MAKDERIQSLRNKHATLDLAIHEEAARSYPNQQYLTDLKRQKLRIKDEIDRLRTTH